MIKPLRIQLTRKKIKLRVMKNLLKYLEFIKIKLYKKIEITKLIITKIKISIILILILTLVKKASKIKKKI